MDESSRLSSLPLQGSSQTLLPHRNGTTTGRRCRHQARGIGSKGAVLVNIWTFLAVTSVLSSGVLTMNNNKVILVYTFLMCIVILIISPIAGFLASIYFSRYRALNTGLWLMWVAEVVMCSVLILQWAYSTVFSSLLVITTLLSFVGFVLFMVNAVPFGLDQMPDASGEQITAFIFWYAWSFQAGAVIVPLQWVAAPCSVHLKGSRPAMLLSILSVALLSVTLCSKFLLRGWLTIEPKGTNPLKTFYGVLRFAAKHKIPVRRSAFTYWEEVKPSRLDLAKMKYGGPYTHEEVEDVKTCLRMVVVIASISVTMTAFNSHVLSASNVLRSDFNTNCSLRFMSLVAPVAVPLGFLIYEVLVRPLIKKWIPSILRRFGWSQCLSITASFLLLVSTTIGYMNTNLTTCSFSSMVFTFDPNWTEVPYTLLTYSFFFLAHTTVLEFICAQAPYILRGLLVGLGYSVVMCSYAVGVALTDVWRVAYQEQAPNSPSCGVWFYLFTTITATLGCVLWCAVAKWYKRREREEPDMCRIFAENYYAH